MMGVSSASAACRPLRQSINSCVTCAGSPVIGIRIGLILTMPNGQAGRLEARRIRKRFRGWLALFPRIALFQSGTERSPNGPAPAKIEYWSMDHSEDKEMAYLVAPRPSNKELPVFYNVEGAVGAQPATNLREDVLLVQFILTFIVKKPAP